MCFRVLSGQTGLLVLQESRVLVEFEERTELKGVKEKGDIQAQLELPERKETLERTVPR